MLNMFLDVPRERQSTPNSLKEFLIDYRPVNSRDGYNNGVERDEQKELTDKHSHIFLKYVLKLVVFSVCIAGCSWQCISILQLFFAFPSTVFVYVQTMDKLQLPGVTICNSNSVMMSKLRQFNKTFDRLWSTYEEYYDSDNNSTKLSKQQLVDETIRSLLHTLTVSEFMSLGHNYDDILVPQYFKCATDPYHPKDPCKNYANILETAQDMGNCFTLFHKSDSKFLEEIAIQSGLSQSPVMRGHGEAVDLEMADQPFHPNEIVRLKMNFSRNEYTKLNEEVFGQIIIHDNDEAPPVREKSFYIYPGFYYEFFLSKQTDHLLRAPYATDCVDYTAQAYNKHSRDLNEYLIHPQSKENCIIGCMADSTMQRCKCWPPELPFIRGSYDEANENKVKWCDWTVGPKIDESEKEKNESWFRYCFTAHESLCNSRCKSDCSIDRYTVIQQDRVWPPRQRIEHSKNGEALQADHECCAIISIRYWTPEHTINRYQAKYEIAEFVSYMGGLLSMWLGFSLLSTYGFIELIITRFYQKKSEYLRHIRHSIHSYDQYLNNATDVKPRLNYDNAPIKSKRRKHTIAAMRWQKVRPKVARIQDMKDDERSHKNMIQYYN